jgi:hypothetical protein
MFYERRTVMRMTLKQAKDIVDLIINAGDLSGAEIMGLEIYGKQIDHIVLLDIAKKG